ncbi:MAG TPA: SCO family protein [Candidatus Angelobacter sp.]
MLHPGKMLIKALARAAANSAAMPPASRGCEPPVPGPHAAYIPNVVVHTHRGQTARFYDDLIRQRIVLINCMSIRDEASCSNMETVAQLQPLIGEDLGRSVFIYSLTTDPEHDTAAALRRFAEKYNARDGWLFLTGDPAELMTLRARLFTHDGGQDCSMHLIRYGNEAVGVWGGVSVMIGAKSIAQRVQWITPREAPAGSPTRGGPSPLSAEG